MCRTLKTVVLPEVLPRLSQAKDPAPEARGLCFIVLIKDSFTAEPPIPLAVSLFAEMMKYNTLMLRKLIDKVPFVRHHFLTTMFLLGFVVDNLTLNRVDQTFDNFVLASYVVFAMVGILSLYAGIAQRFSDRVNLFTRTWSPALIQYAFGGLLSGILIFYGRSSAFFESWPYILLILVAIVGNETIKNRDQRLVYNLAIFFIGLFSYVVLMIPVWSGKMGALTFFLSGCVAVFIMYWFFKVLTWIVPNFIALQRRTIVFSIGLIYLTFNFFYFANIIPPIPLSLKDLGIYHNVIRYENDTYSLTYEKPAWWLPLRKSDSTFHYEQGDNIYCYASVFAPAKLRTDIYHTWEYYDTELGKWTEHGRYRYDIKGGRGEGFRGYTVIESVREGEWRCTVETERGQALGREEFTVVKGGKGEMVTRTD